MKTHYNSSYRTWSNLDLVFCSSQISKDIFVYPHKYLAGRNHCPMIIQYKFYEQFSPYSDNVRFNLKKVSWYQYISSYPQNIQLDLNSLVNEIVNLFCFTLIQNVKFCARPLERQSSINSHEIPTPWWIDKCSKVIRERHKALKNLKSYPV